MARLDFLWTSGSGRMVRECPGPRPKHCARVASLPVLPASGLSDDNRRDRQEMPSNSDGSDRDGSKDIQEERDRAFLVELSLEYLGLAPQLEDLSEVERERMREIERSVYEFYEEIGEPRANKVALSFRVFATLIYQYRIWPEERKRMH